MDEPSSLPGRELAPEDRNRPRRGWYLVRRDEGWARFRVVDSDAASIRYEENDGQRGMATFEGWRVMVCAGDIRATDPPARAQASVSFSVEIEQLGAHSHVRVFAGSTPFSRALTGTLITTPAESEELKRRLATEPARRDADPEVLSWLARLPVGPPALPKERERLAEAGALACERCHGAGRVPAPANADGLPPVIACPDCAHVELPPHLARAFRDPDFRRLFNAKNPTSLALAISVAQTADRTVSDARRARLLASAAPDEEYQAACRAYYAALDAAKSAWLEAERVRDGAR